MQSTYIRTLLTLVTALGVFTPPSAEAKSLTRQSVIKTAHKQVGLPYVWGGETRTGFDCSGLVQYVFARARIAMPRTADAQYAMGRAVALGAIMPGDLMFFNTGRRQAEVTHVGIYMGNDHMLHAPGAGRKVSYASVGPRSWFRPRLLGIRRIERQHFELARKPIGWEVGMMPKDIAISVVDNELKIAAAK